MEKKNMKIAIPTAEGILCSHFGHCEKFAIIDVDNGEIKEINWLTPPPHEPGVLPRFLKTQGVDLIIAGGIGWRAQEIFRSFGIEVLVGAPSKDPRELVKEYIRGALETGRNLCDH